ncbi:MAG: aromatic ring-hydroxylating dioxygenase subunit alpha [Saprospiraceae bacterium]|nr:aromatic ring-hydroxylating dioxygenase subunit alpha [Saprospiraceae bacterium]
MSRFFVHPEIAHAKTISKDIYLSQEILEESKEKIFSSSWQYIGDKSRVPDAGSIFPFTLLEGHLEEPLVLSCDKHLNIHCLSNVCTHRGNLVTYEACKSSQLRCKYHGRIFDLDGKFRFMPEFEGVQDFPSETDDLKRLPLHSWGNLLFTSANPAAPAEHFFSEMQKLIEWFPMDDLQYRPDLSAVYPVQANWALYCENYLEGFHIPFVHGSLSAVLDYGNYSTELFRYSNLQLGIGKKGENCFDLPESSLDYGKNVAAYYFWVFPNMMFNFYPWGLSLNLVEPTGIDSCRVKFEVFVLDERKLQTGAGSGLNQVELEDEEVVQQVQKGIRSRFYKYGRYSISREQGTHHFHRLLSEFLG